MPPAAQKPAGARPTHAACEIADIFRRHGDAYRAARRLPLSHWKVMHAIEACRTSALGGHRESCAQCGYVRYAYNSCRNRHCPKCQAFTKAQWLAQRQAELLPVPYFHNVFTLPHQLNPLLLWRQDNQRLLLGLLMRASAEVLLTFARNNLGGKPALSIVLHTWDQQLHPHYHTHCVISGGVLTAEGKWRTVAGNYLFSVKALSAVFRAKFLAGLQTLLAANQLQLPPSLKTLADPVHRRSFLKRLARKKWVVYSKRPFAGPQKVLDYLGRYTHRVAISNQRILRLADGQVHFSWRDRRDGDRKKVAAIPAEEFIRRFLHHVLPSGFMRIRHYGILANAVKSQALRRARKQLQTPPPEFTEQTVAQWMLETAGIDITACPQCGQRPLARTTLLPMAVATAVPATARAPPESQA